MIKIDISKDGQHGLLSYHCLKVKPEYLGYVGKHSTKQLLIDCKKEQKKKPRMKIIDVAAMTAPPSLFNPTHYTTVKVF